MTQLSHPINMPKKGLLIAHMNVCSLRNKEQGVFSMSLGCILIFHVYFSSLFKFNLTYCTYLGIGAFAFLRYVWKVYFRHT